MSERKSPAETGHKSKAVCADSRNSLTLTGVIAKPSQPLILPMVITRQVHAFNGLMVFSSGFGLPVWKQPR